MAVDTILPIAGNSWAAGQTNTSGGSERCRIMVTGRDTGGLVQFLQDDLAISPDSINMALRHCEQDSGPLPMVLWQYGLITLEQLEKIYDWLDAAWL